MKPRTLVLATLALAAAATTAEAQRQRTGTAFGSVWGWYYLETGGAGMGILGDGDSFLWGGPAVVITIMSRDGHALSEGDRTEATAVARALCEQGGREFNTRTRGHWLANGGLGFHGECSRW
jgi:hypothetical protein